MKKFENRRKIKKMIFSIPTLVVLLLVIFVFGRNAWASYKGARLAAENLAMATNEKEELMARIESLEQNLDGIDTERGTEEAVREKFGLVREGETAIVLLDPEDEFDENELSKRSLWRKFLDLFN
jgi:cell division protein FtsB